MARLPQGKDCTSPSSPAPADNARSTADESFVVIRFANPKGIDFPYLLAMIGGAFMSRLNIIVVPGRKMELAMQLILTPLILQLMDRKKKSAREVAFA